MNDCLFPPLKNFLHVNLLKHLSVCLEFLMFLWIFLQVFQVPLSKNIQVGGLAMTHYPLTSRVPWISSVSDMILNRIIIITTDGLNE